MTSVMTFVARCAAVFGRMARHSLRQPAFAYLIPTVFPLGLVVIISQLYERLASFPAYGGLDQLDWMGPGTVFLAACMGGGFTATVMVVDAADGFLDRLRLLPVPHTALVLGALTFEAARQLPIAAVLLVFAAVLGLPMPGVGGIVLVLALSALWAATWNAGFLVAGIRSRNPDIAQALLPMFLPFLLASSIMVPRALMPSYLDTLAGYNPLEYLIIATRPLFFDLSAAGADIARAVAICTGLLVIAGAASLVSLRRMPTTRS